MRIKAILKPILIARYAAAGALLSITAFSTVYSLITGHPSPASGELIAGIGGGSVIAFAKAASFLS